MTKLIINNIAHELKAIDEIPESFKPFGIKGSEAEYFNGRFGQFLVQKIQSEFFQISHSVFRIKEECSVKISGDNEYLGSHISLVNNSICQISGLGEFIFLEGQCNLFYLPVCNWVSHFHKKEQYVTLDVLFHKNMITLFAKSFPDSKSLLNSQKKGIAFSLYSNQMSLGFEMVDIVHKILACNFNDPFRTAYLKIKVTEWLFTLMILASTDSGIQNIHMKKELEKWHAVKFFITENYTKHYSISTIAREFRTNTTTLQKGFRGVFGSGLFEYLIKLRMSKAIGLLQNSQSTVSQVADKIGYGNAASFIKAFKKHFGYTPGHMRKIFR